MRFDRFRAATLTVLLSIVVSIAGCGGASSFKSVASTPIVASATPMPSGAGSPPANAPAPPPPSPPAPPAPAPPPPAPPAPAPPAPAGATLSSIEQMQGWDSCDTCTGGGTIAFSMVQGVNYPQPGNTQFSVGQGTPWAHALFWKRLGSDTSISHFVLTLDQYMENPAASFGIEYEANQIIDGLWYDFAAECSFGYGIWQVWDPAGQHWVPTSVPCTRPAANTTVQVRLEFQRVNGQAVFVSIGTNGNVVPVNLAFNPEAISGANGDFGVHIQLNANANPDSYSVWVHDMALNYW